MKLTATIITTVLAAITTALPAASSSNPSALISHEARDQCVFNAAIEKSWTENLLTRYRTRFSTSAPNVDMCKTIQIGLFNPNCDGITSNYQCWYSNEDNSWVFDMSEVAGPAGWDVINCEVQSAIRAACDNLGCRTG